MSTRDELLDLISDWKKIKEEGCAHNIRENGKSVERLSTDEIEITPKADGSGLDIHVKAGVKGKKVAIPACVTAADIDDLVYNDFFIAEGADVTIIAGCGIHVHNGEAARHSGIHRFFLAPHSKVLYLEKHVGTGGTRDTKRVIDPVTEVTLGEGSTLEMDTSQIGGVDETRRVTRGSLASGARLIVKEHLLTEGVEKASTDFEITLEGDDSAVDLVSRSVARGHSSQSYRSVITGKARCTGHSECDAIITEEGRVSASPALNAESQDASLIHEAAIGKIAGEQIMKLRTFGLSEEEAEQKIIEGFLR